MAPEFCGALADKANCAQAQLATMCRGVYARPTVPLLYRADCKAQDAIHEDWWVWIVEFGSDNNYVCRLCIDAKLQGSNLVLNLTLDALKCFSI